MEQPLLKQHYVEDIPKRVAFRLYVRYAYDRVVKANSIVSRLGDREPRRWLIPQRLGYDL